MVVLNNSLFRMVSTRPLIFKSSSLGTNLLVTVPSAPITISITIIIIIISLYVSSLHQRQLVVFTRRQSDSKFSQVSRNLLSILADLKNALVWVVLIRLKISIYYLFYYYKILSLFFLFFFFSSFSFIVLFFQSFLCLLRFLLRPRLDFCLSS